MAMIDSITTCCNRMLTTAKALVSVAAVCGTLGATCTTASAQAWQQVWSDEFHGTTLNATNWTPITGAWPYNDERQYYSPSAISVANGLGVITSTNQAQGGRLYTSGRMDTMGKRAFMYGRFEMRAKLPQTQGIWPAFWLLPATNQWPPEIDIMELLGHQPNKTYGSNHWGNPPTSTYQTSSLQLATTTPNFATAFNTFACEWWPDRIDFFVNNTLFATHRSRVPQEPMYVIVNTAVGGFWPGYPNGTTVFPQRFEIDWIRVSQVSEPLLKNSGMEWPGPAGSNQRMWHWQHWGNAEYSEALPRSGVGALKMYGNFNVPNNSSGMFQDLPAQAGQTFTATARMQTPSWDRMGPNTQARISIEFRNSAGTLLTSGMQTGLTSASAPNVWTDVSVERVAPANTATARMVLSFLQGNGLSSGAAWVDDVTFTRRLPAGCDGIDFNGDGLFPDDADLIDLLNVLAGGACSTGPACSDIDFNNDGLFPDDADLVAFLRVLSGGVCD